VAILAGKFDSLSKPAFIVCFAFLQVSIPSIVPASLALRPHPPFTVLLQLRSKYVCTFTPTTTRLFLTLVFIAALHIVTQRKVRIIMIHTTSCSDTSHSQYSPHVSARLHTASPPPQARQARSSLHWRSTLLARISEPPHVSGVRHPLCLICHS
jgi:hypothetical protein